MRVWFESLQPREQLFVGIGALAVVLVILWGLIWLPLTRGHKNLQQSVVDWEQSLAELRPLGAAVQSGAGPGQQNTQTSNQTAVVIVDQTLRARGLNTTMQRSRPTSNGIQVEFENVAFDELVLWLGDLSAQHALEVQAGSLSVGSRVGPGRINASLTLERAP